MEIIVHTRRFLVASEKTSKWVYGRKKKNRNLKPFRVFHTKYFPIKFKLSPAKDNCNRGKLNGRSARSEMCLATVPGSATPSTVLEGPHNSGV